MKTRLRQTFRRASRRKTTTQATTDAAVSRGMADLLTALDTAIDDDTALNRIYAAAGTNLPGARASRGAATPAGPSGPARTARASGPAPSRRRLALRSAAAVAAALIAAGVALAATGLPGVRQGGPEGPAVSTAYVVKRVDRALDAAEPGAIAQMTVTTRTTTTSGQSVTATAEEWSYGDQWRAVTYTPAGQPLSDEGLSTASAYTIVSYQTHTWARQTKTGHPAALAPGTRGCGPVVAGLPLLFTPGITAIGLPATSLPATVARALRAAVSCGTLTETGHQRIDGTQTIKLTSRPGSPIPETIWVSPGTYLPVRVTSHPAPGTAGPGQTATITWLPPTPGNLAKLTIPIPASFRHVPLTTSLLHTPTRTKT
jgi:hypothetical protein